MDRGICDNEVYIDPESWQTILDSNNWKTPDLRDKRYDLVIHLVSAAIGAEKFYTLSNNEARRETVEEAASLDMRIRDSYIVRIKK
jgi:hypothetical protein